jgi:hypothetical protein
VPADGFEETAWDVELRYELKKLADSTLAADVLLQRMRWRS